MSNSAYQSYPDPNANGSNNASGYNAGPATGSGAGYPQSQYQNMGAGNNAVGPSVVSPYSPNLSPHFSGTTGMLMLLAVISLYEGTLRTIEYSNTQNGGTWGSTYNSFPYVATLIGGIWESFYALLTLFIAIWALIFDWHSIALTTFTLLMQLLGWYTVVVFAIANPAYNDNHNLGIGHFGGDVNSNSNNASYVFGWIFSLLCVDGAVLAGMMFFTIQLMQIQTNKVDELHTPFYYGRRLGLWSLIELFLGLSQIIYGAEAVYYYTAGNVGGAPIYYYPNITTYGVFPLITGILFTIVGFWGLITACVHNLHISNSFIGLSWITFLWVLGGHVLGSCGVINETSNVAGYGMAEMGMFLGTLMIPMYLAYKAATIETVARGPYGYGAANNYNNRPVVV